MRWWRLQVGLSTYKIKGADDILTLEEAINDSDFAGEDSFTPDYTREMEEEAIRSGKITVYNINKILPRNKKIPPVWPALPPIQAALKMMVVSLLKEYHKTPEKTIPK